MGSGVAQAEPCISLAALGSVSAQDLLPHTEFKHPR